MAKASTASAEQGREASRSQRWGETLRAVFWAAVLALGIRTFVIEPFKIPSGSMIPTLLVGDYVLVKKFAYGVRLPIVDTLVLEMDPPQRGDIVVFRYPDNPRQDFIKRIVGVPGDRVEMRENRPWVNGQPLDRIPQGVYEYSDGHGRRVRSQRFTEIAPGGAEYTVIQSLAGAPPGSGDRSWVVPEGHYFMMGDNRDNSQDSRRWSNTFVAASQIKGKAFRIHWSWVVSSEPQPERGFVMDLLYTVYRVVTFQVEEVRWGRVGRRLDGVAD
jgi:signal peptidase I